MEGNIVHELKNKQNWCTSWLLAYLVVDLLEDPGVCGWLLS
jgi:hypothetical protein